jgi:NAD(P)-dependent dehydrogenase (short-subunit alcohol dehydrogenase family)
VSESRAGGDRHVSTSLDGAVAVVTGASSGLGERFARVLHAAGASVVLAARRTDRLEALAAELGPRALPVRCDVASADDRSALIETALSRLDRVDVLVNNAGIGTPSPAEDQPLDDFQRTMDVNVVAVFHLSQLAGRHMLQRGSGSIVNISSMFGVVAAAPVAHAAYCASKSAVIGLTRELAAQWASRGVRVNALAPGWFATEMNESMWTDERSLDHVRRGTPMRRRGEVGELDGALLLLAGDAGTFITGQTLVVDGGWTIR